MSIATCAACGTQLAAPDAACGTCAAANFAASLGVHAPRQAALPSPRQSGGRFLFHLRRALGWNLREAVVEPQERERLIALSVDEEDARRYLCWRRSVLIIVTVPTLISALLATIGSLASDHSGLSSFGIGLELVRLAALYALPVTAWLASRAWDQHRRSRTILLRGWFVAFLTPLALALFPFHWRIDLSGGDPTIANQAAALLGLLGAVAVYVTLMPAVLSLIPGVLRACLRVKALLPASILPGWFLVASTPLYVLFFLVIFTTVNQLAGNALLILAVLSLLGAPLLYMFNAKTFTRPLHAPEEIARIGRVQQQVGIVTGIGVTLLVLYAFKAELFGHSLIGIDTATSLMRPWDTSLFQIPLEYVLRSLFTTVVVADLFMLMNLSVWHDTKAFAASPEAQAYDRVMIEIEEAGGRL